ncbi:acetyl-CoA decarbonylase/synthase complex subunit delta [candidate division LCP-89 bacterium B3_LCP]|uniref:Acetyl-CoA decarbonylase/synthase complex subunit delta n=1 Tax=candidate division LCP-89 bacterium B3_LCP TaxID=2012998 RepID=A0A532UPI6_UNCL8|nr:MAG: acetyl-CoA decarbonylase/synthase complex subunit delta [candidate division LCP-89 bacterium B3_LCP]
MPITLPTKTWSGVIREVQLGRTAEQGGSRTSQLTIGGQKALPFHHFEGEIPHRPVIAYQIPDADPPQNDWPDALKEPFKDVIGDPVDWAKLVVEKYNAKLICLNFISAHPDRGDRPVDDCVKLLREVMEVVGVPIIVQGYGSDEKNAEILSKCAEECRGEGLTLASAFEEQYKTLAAATVAYDCNLVAETPIDVNLAKQLNILLTNMNVPSEKIIIDPLTGGLGYGYEYTYSVMERIRLQALGDDSMMCMPFINFVGQETWKTKEAKLPELEAPSWGSELERGVLWEAITAHGLLLAGSDVLVMRHPEAVKQVEIVIDELMATD